MKKVIVAVLCLAMLLAACGAPAGAPTEPPAPDAAPAPDEAQAPAATDPAAPEGTPDERITISVENLVGVWAAADFMENLRYNDLDRAYSMYVTDDCNLYLIVYAGTTAGPMPRVLHFKYELIDNEVVLEIVEDTWRTFHTFGLEEYQEQLQIEFRGNTVRLRAENLNEGNPIVLHRESDEVPFGWTDADTQQMIDTREWITQEILDHAEKFSNAIGVTLVPGRLDEFSDFGLDYVMGFTIESDDDSHPEFISIALIEAPPTPTQPQSHLGGNFNAAFIQILPASRVSNDRFYLLYDYHFQDREKSTPEEWLDIFVLL